jgi:hypothetical protein
MSSSPSTTSWRRRPIANALGRQDGILLKLNTVVSAPAPFDYFKRHQKFLKEGESVVICMVAPQSLDAFLAYTGRQGGRVAFNRSALSEEELRGLPVAYELAWNHTTLRGLRIDPAITYLQVLYPFPNQLALIEKLHKMFEGEIIDHLEFVRFDGDITCFGLPMVRFSTEERLEEIMATFNKEGAPIFNPHRYTLEEGGMKQTDEVQLAFKREADPKGAAEPGQDDCLGEPGLRLRHGWRLAVQGLAEGGVRQCAFWCCMRIRSPKAITASCIGLSSSASRRRAMRWMTATSMRKASIRG